MFTEIIKQDTSGVSTVKNHGFQPSEVELTAIRSGTSRANVTRLVNFKNEMSSTISHT